VLARHQSTSSNLIRRALVAVMTGNRSRTEAHGHSHGHGRKHGNGKRDEGREPNFTWEWFWGCCYCSAHASMSTFIESCPGCTHLRCNDCPMEAVKISSANNVPNSMAPSTNSTTAPRNFSRNHSYDLLSFFC
jgi:hypothetical protein